MDSKSWAVRLSSASKRYQSAFHSRSGMKLDNLDAEMLMGFEEIDMDDDVREEYSCPFCSEHFDIVGLCCHIDDEHPLETKTAVCPVCAMRVGVDMVAHITLHHGSIFKAQQRKRRSRKYSSHLSTLGLFRRELRDGNLQSIFGGGTVSSSNNNAAPDPLLSSFISPTMIEDYQVSPSHSESSMLLIKKGTNDITGSERKVQQEEAPPMSIKDQVEKTKRCNFVQGLLFSTMMLDIDSL